MSDPVGPVCHIPPTNTPGNPQPNNIPAIPPVPSGTPGTPAFNNQLLAFLQALRQMMLLLQQSSQNGGISNNVTSNGNSKKATWQEDRSARVTEKVKVEDPNNPETFVEFDRINSYTMVDKAGGGKFVWNR